MRDERTICALSQSLHQIELAQSVEVGVGIGFAVGSECRIDQINPCAFDWSMGTIAIESKPMGGTTIYVRVPFTTNASSVRAVG